MYCVFATVVALSYIFWDVNYFLRTIFTIVIGRLFQKKCGINDTTTIYGFCTTQDLDIVLRHLNNARYFRELDFARYHFIDRTGIYASMKKTHACFLQGASIIRFRRTIPIFTAYRIETKIAYWNEKALFFEQKFITLSDGFVRSIAISKQNVVNVDVETLFKGISGADDRPECPEEIKYWSQAIEVSRAKLRKEG